MSGAFRITCNFASDALKDVAIEWVDMRAPDLGVDSELSESIGLGARGRRLHLDTAQHVPLKPDLSLWRDGQCRFVGDVKYKLIEAEGHRNADLYQLLSYCVATDLHSGMLIYAAGEGEPFRHEVVNFGHVLEVVKLDLRVPPSSVLAQVALIAERIRAQAASSQAA